MSNVYVKEGLTHMLAAMCGVPYETVQTVVKNNRQWLGLDNAVYAALTSGLERTKVIVESLFQLRGVPKQTLQQVGDIVGVSGNRVGQIRDKTLRVIRTQHPAFYQLAEQLQAAGCRSHALNIILKRGISYKVLHLRELLETDREGFLQNTFRVLKLPGLVYEQLDAIGVETIADLCAHTRGELVAKTHLKTSDFNDIEAALATYGLQLRESKKKPRKR